MLLGVIRGIELVSLVMLLTSDGSVVLVTVPPIVTEDSVMVTVVVYEPIAAVCVCVSVVLGLQSDQAEQFPAEQKPGGPCWRFSG